MCSRGEEERGGEEEEVTGGLLITGTHQRGCCGNNICKEEMDKNKINVPDIWVLRQTGLLAGRGDHGSQSRMPEGRETHGPLERTLSHVGERALLFCICHCRFASMCQLHVCLQGLLQIVPHEA